MTKQTYDHVTYYIVQTLKVHDSIVIEVLCGERTEATAACAYFEQFSDRDGRMVAKLPASVAAINSGRRTFRVRDHAKPGHKIIGLRIFNKDIPTLKAWWEATGEMKGNETWG